MNYAVTALGHPGRHVKVYDPDTLSEANMGCQLFGAFDVGQSKPHVLVNRIYAFCGLVWESAHARYDGGNSCEQRSGLAIACADSARARHDTLHRLRRCGVLYLLDLGNCAADGQVFFGELFAGRAGLAARADSAFLPSSYDILPELIGIQAK